MLRSNHRDTPCSIAASTEPGRADTPAPPAVAVHSSASPRDQTESDRARADTRPVLVTGGAGFLGINLVRLLLHQGYAVRSLDIAQFDYPERTQVDVRQGDIRDVAAVNQAVLGVGAVIHCAAALPLYPAEEIRTSIVDGTARVLAASLGHGVERVVFISSTAVYGIPDHHPLREQDPLHGVGPYGCAKIAAESLCREYRARGLCVPILRPKTFVGPERLGVFALLFDWASEGRNFPVLGRGDNRYQLLDVEDLSRACVSCLVHDRHAVNDTFNVGAREFASIRDDFQAVLDRAGYDRHIVGLPATPARWLLRLCAWMGISPLYEWVYETAATDSWVATERIEQALGFTPVYSNRQALLRSYEWYLAHRREFGADTGISHRARWRAGVLGVAKWLF